MTKLISSPKKFRTTKIEQFLKVVILAGRLGIKPLNIAIQINTNNIARFASDLRRKGIEIDTKPLYRFSNFYDAQIALDFVNSYRKKRGASQLPQELLEEWL